MARRFWCAEGALLPFPRLPGAPRACCSPSGPSTATRAWWRCDRIVTSLSGDVDMRFLTTFQAYDFLDTLVSLTAAFILGTLIGAERQYRQRTAGLRTNVLVAVGAAAFVDLAMHLNGADGAVRVIAYVVSGIGFLGAGVIMKQGMDVRGLNTAATLWASAAVGSCAGADMVAQAAALTVFVLAGNTLLRPLVNAINRAPINEQASEATYFVKLLVDEDAASRLREQVVERLAAAQDQVAEV